jgi:hypothetical protein
VTIGPKLTVCGPGVARNIALANDLDRACDIDRRVMVAGKPPQRIGKSSCCSTAAMWIASASKGRDRPNAEPIKEPCGCCVRCSPGRDTRSLIIGPLRYELIVAETTASASSEV